VLEQAQWRAWRQRTAEPNEVSLSFALAESVASAESAESHADQRLDDELHVWNWPGVIK